MPKAVPPSPEHYTMSFGEHLDELRRRMIFALLGSTVVFCVALYYGRLIVSFLFEPLIVVQRLLGLPTQAYTRSPVGGFTLYLKVAMTAALVVAAPWILYQLWRFVAPGLYVAERRLALFLVGLSSAMTFVALALSYYVFLPAYLTFVLLWTTTYPPPPTGSSQVLRFISQQFIVLNQKTFPGMAAPATAPAATTTNAATTAPGPATSATPPSNSPTGVLIIPSFPDDPPQPLDGQMWYNAAYEQIRQFRRGRVEVIPSQVPSTFSPLPDPNEYLSELLWLALLTVVIFHIPVVMAILGMTGLIDPAAITKRRKIVIFSCFVAAIFLTPSQDAFTNIVMPLMAWALFEFGLVLMRVFYRRKQRADAAHEE